MSIRAHVNARRLDQRVLFERATRDANGDPTGWTPLGRPVWAAVDGQKASERVVADGMRSVHEYTVWVRADVTHGLGVTLADRIRWVSNGDKVLDINGMPDQGLRGRLIAIFCDSGVNEG